MKISQLLIFILSLAVWGHDAFAISIFSKRSKNPEFQYELHRYCESDTEVFSEELVSSKFYSHLRSKRGDPSETDGRIVSGRCLEKIQRSFEKLKKDQEKEVCRVSQSKECKSFQRSSKKQISKLEKAKIKYLKPIERYEEQVWRGYNIERPMSEFDEELFKSQNCEGLSRIGSASRSIEVDRALNRKLDEIIENSNVHCLNRMMNSYLYNRNFYTDSENAYGKFCDKYGTQKCEQINEQRMLTTQNFLKLQNKLYNHSQITTYQQEVYCKYEQGEDLRNLLGEIEKYKDIIKCLPLTEGEVRTNRFPLKKINSKKYEAMLALNFSSDIPGQSKKMEDHVKSCVASYSQYLNGPNGENLDVKIYNSEEILKVLKPYQISDVKNITIQKKGFRSHSLAYEESISCPVVMHEVLHLLGLWDEYQEKFNKDLYKCRTVPSVPSVMKNQNEVFNLAVGKKFECECVGDQCKKIIASNDDALKEMYLGSNVYDAIDYKFRNQNCKMISGGERYLYDDLSEHERKSSFIAEETEHSFIASSYYFQPNFPSLSKGTISCSCSPEDADCLTQLNQIKQKVLDAPKSYSNGCPSGARNVSVEEFKSNDSDVPLIEDIDESRFVYNKKPAWNSFLHPNQFQFLINSNCTEGGARYDKCTKSAYTSEDCFTVPSECSNDEYFLGVKAL